MNEPTTDDSEGAAPSWADFQGANLGYVLDLWERWHQDREAVDQATASLMALLGPPPTAGDPSTGLPGASVASPSPHAGVAGAVALAHAIRDYGHLEAALFPLGDDPPGDPSLALEAHSLTEADLRALPASIVGGHCAERAADAAEAIEQLRACYSGSIGHDHRQVRAPEERHWLADVAESGRFSPPDQDQSSKEQDWQLNLLDQLTAVEAFEQFLHRVFPGRHRFSIEGLDTLVPMLNDLVRLAAEGPAESLLVGMAHRGRLSVMTFVMQRPYAEVLAAFKDPLRAWGVGVREDLGWTGDVKYHHGAVELVKGHERPDLCVTLLPNPSHLEFVNPVVQGMARAAGEDVAGPGRPRFDADISIPVAVHGDASFPAQGVVAETFNLSRIPGYRTGGTIHIIANNRIGFTTDPEEGRSTLFASDLAKGFRAPIMHVNADDPAACIEATRIAWAYRAQFRKDIVIDLIGYRRHGHNEGDEPAYTQPLRSKAIDSHPTVRKLWADRLVEAGLIEHKGVATMLRDRLDALSAELEALDIEPDSAEDEALTAAPTSLRIEAAERHAPVPLTRLRQLDRSLLALPDGFAVHPKLQRARDRRAEALADQDASTVDWTLAEELALASILADGTAVRLTGQDSARGTFSQRHAVLHDVRTGESFSPLAALPQAEASFQILNSPLSEVAALGFEHGYNVQASERLVIWEAQYGDFGNVAQVIFDEFLFSGRAKWSQTPSLVLLLPHGHEGAGPDHSSARPERFLQLAADGNLRLAYPSTAAQYFHLLRLQAASLKVAPCPLVVLTPKSLLRAAIIRSTPRELAEGGWRTVIDDPRPKDARASVQRLILCSGKVWADMVTDERWQPDGATAIARLEQAYPFPARELNALWDIYSGLKEVVWVQEEPENMGFWEFVRPRLKKLIDNRWPLSYIGRPRSASPAEGVAAWHKQNQDDLMRHALQPDSTRERGDLVAIERSL